MTDPDAVRRRPDHLGGLPIDPDIDSEEDARHHPAGAAASVPPLRFSPRVVAAVYAGGVLGGLARYEVSRVLPSSAQQFPWATFAVNTAGAFALALVLVLVLEVLRPRWYLRPAIGTGFLGAFTTFSSVVTSTDDLAGRGHGGLAAAFVVGSMAAGLLAAMLGLLAGKMIAAHRPGSAGPA